MQYLYNRFLGSLKKLFFFFKNAIYFSFSSILHIHTKNIIIVISYSHLHQSRPHSHTFNYWDALMRWSRESFTLTILYVTMRVNRITVTRYRICIWISISGTLIIHHLVWLPFLVFFIHYMWCIARFNLIIQSVPYLAIL